MPSSASHFVIHDKPAHAHLTVIRNQTTHCTRNVSLFILLTCFFYLATSPHSSAKDAPTIKVKATIYHGQNDGIEDHLAKSPALKKKLSTLFGYSGYEKIGSSYAILPDPQGKQKWLHPTKKFYLCMTPSKKRKNAFMFEVFQEERSLFQGEYIPKPKIPLIIKGPNYDQGVLILVLHQES